MNKKIRIVIEEELTKLIYQKKETVSEIECYKNHISKLENQKEEMNTDIQEFREFLEQLDRK